jgi:hypothetical protein
MPGPDRIKRTAHVGDAAKTCPPIPCQASRQDVDRAEHHRDFEIFKHWDQAWPESVTYVA